ncbi:hypothetical protein BJ875DRAFT_517826 [Amylocarpus encephaloides]|uniref:phosphatidylinositol-3,4,5-trisphosphate 3-phosphatase n=1 Tax=Amylocarpus encephaloides TaxID=45428 RepID=A0A9P7YCJ5_9HELO|nr:hypothetical protein BJ875DRAFT_517826 [Amylocarpus encephaloides]
MTSILRQIVAGPRTRHPEAGLDLCYVTDQIIATSGPSSTYPQRAYRNPLNQLVKFLDYKHGEEWAIWEFRAEGTGYPDGEVYGRVWHYPWPDHHPPPFRLVPMIMGGMKKWLSNDGKEGDEGKNGKTRVVVVHCKAGKGRSGTMACSYLISECGWEVSEALARFTERRMRPGFGQGVSIPSQLRWVGYVDRWTKTGKIYVERQMEVMEVHVWGLREGVKVQVEGFVDEGKTIKIFHVFHKKERVVVEGNAPGGGGIKDMISDMAGMQNEQKVPMSKTSTTIEVPINAKSASSSSLDEETTELESGGNAVIFKPSARVILPTSDINIDFERRNKASIGWTMVTAVAHVWFNTFFEGSGPEQGGKPDDNGVFEIEWDKMDGLKGSSRKGTRAFDRLSVVWKSYDPDPGYGKNEEQIHEPGVDSPVPQMAAADWKGVNEASPEQGKSLGLRTENPASAAVSKASSMDSHENDESDSEEGVKSCGPQGEEVDVDVEEFPQPRGNSPQPTLEAIKNNPDTATSTTPQRSTEVPSPFAESPQALEPAGGALMIPTSDLPGGVPQDQLKTSHAHGLGHLQAKKHTIDS